MQDQSLDLPLNRGKGLHIPLLNKWLVTKVLPLLCVEDMVHIAVKFKSRLLKPSIILPMGSFLATTAHLHIRLRDLDHKDKQNFAAVEHILRASPLLDDMPDALGTKCYLEASVYIYLDKSYSPAKRLEEIWFATFSVDIGDNGYAHKNNLC